MIYDMAITFLAYMIIWGAVQMGTGVLQTLEPWRVISWFSCITAIQFLIFGAACGYYG